MIKEQAKEREEQVTGGWYTKEAMAKDLGYSKQLERINLKFRNVLFSLSNFSWRGRWLPRSRRTA